MNRSNVPSPKILLREQLALAAMSGAGVLVSVLAFTIGYARLSDNMVDRSFWNEAISGIARWYVLVIGISLMAETFPRYILYGDTRKRMAQRITLFSIPFCAALAVLALLGLWIERFVYRIAGWDHTIRAGHLYDAPADIPAFLLEFLVILLPWFCLGALIGATFISKQELLVVVVPLAIAGVAAVSILLGSTDGVNAIFDRWYDQNDHHTIAGVVASIAVSSVALVALRRITRDTAIENQSA